MGLTESLKIEAADGSLGAVYLRTSALARLELQGPPCPT
jgi:hypothetical protein